MVDVSPSLMRASTQDVPERQRIDYWEAYNASSLTGIRCSTHDSRGLSASVTRCEVRGLSLSDIRGNQHIVERTPQIVRERPKDSIFACVLIEGSAFFYQHSRFLNVSAGDVLIYDAEQPFLYGFPGGMRQILIDIPRLKLMDDCKAGQLSTPVHIDGHMGAGRTLSGALRNAGLRLMAGGNPEDAERCWQLISAIFSGGKGLQRSRVLPLVEAKSIISSHLSNTELGPEFVAERLGISARHLNRLFGGEQVTVSEYIRNKRLDCAHRDLSDTGQASATIGEIAYRWGFADLGNFNRAFRHRFAVTPSDVRRQASLKTSF
ncbi:helix-turn-helix domain-containing protein [Chelatococcus asaccharovorans]|uniref:helix-turn-helix domain-containing protein n=1 Tax=Chelatococcus asaccharovorans TaxID=28210 RepID=UPI002263CDE3|nr:helix-turn-helix domain-containing protein [Chelatococcus asaccharovorans]